MIELLKEIAPRVTRATSFVIQRAALGLAIAMIQAMAPQHAVEHTPIDAHSEHGSPIFFKCPRSASFDCRIDPFAWHRQSSQGLFQEKYGRRRSDTGFYRYFRKAMAAGKRHLTDCFRPHLQTVP
jgi:hypothetical protein